MKYEQCADCRYVKTKVIHAQFCGGSFTCADCDDACLYESTNDEKNKNKADEYNKWIKSICEKESNQEYEI